MVMALQSTEFEITPETCFMTPAISYIPEIVGAAPLTEGIPGHALSATGSLCRGFVELI